MVVLMAQETFELDLEASVRNSTYYPPKIVGSSFTLQILDSHCEFQFFLTLSLFISMVSVQLPELLTYRTFFTYPRNCVRYDAYNKSLIQYH